MVYTKADLKLFKEKQLKENDIHRQIANFEKGFHYIQLIEPATIGNGILQFTPAKEEQLVEDFEQKRNKLQIIKMVPASGSATRMFKDLFQFIENYQGTEKEFLDFMQSKQQNSMYYFFNHLEELPFYSHLESILWNDKKDLKKMLAKREYKSILKYILDKEGLNYGNTPKGLVDFHIYRDFIRTAFDEHIVEGALYCHNNQTSSLHFTVSQEHLSLFKNRLKKISKIFEKRFQIKFDVTFSIQKPSTDTISIDDQGNLLRDSKGNIIFRPGGHGALIYNLNELKADLVFIKNIDNVVPDRAKEDTIKYKKILASTLLETQEKVFHYLNILDKKPDTEELQKIEDFIKQIGYRPNISLKSENDKEKIKYFKGILNRPIRVCGMVKNEGEPGGGPFWATSSDGQTRLMIIESAQIDTNRKDQQQIFNTSTHFNPVDLVCGLKDYKGNKFDLTQFIDPEQGFITQKSYQGKNIKVQELPGLWNGAMANWLTIFVEVPLTTFTPVKTVFDLFRIEHRNIL